MECIREGSRLDKYAKQLYPLLARFQEDSTEKNFKALEDFLFTVFHEVLPVVIPSDVKYAIQLKLFYNSEEYYAKEKEANENPFVVNKEISKVPTLAFVMTNPHFSLINVNIGGLFSKVKNSASFIFNYSAALIHEVCHIIHPEKSTEEIHKLEIANVEKFLQIAVPDAYKNQKMNDYYFLQT